MRGRPLPHFSDSFFCVDDRQQHCNFHCLWDGLPEKELNQCRLNGQPQQPGDTAAVCEAIVILGLLATHGSKHHSAVQGRNRGSSLTAWDSIQQQAAPSQSIWKQKGPRHAEHTSLLSWCTTNTLGLKDQGKCL